MSLPVCIPSLNNKGLCSQWGHLSPNLIARFYQVKRVGEDVWVHNEECDPISVLAPLIEANMEMVLNWQSPFEQAGPESRAPTLLAMLQSGAFKPIIDSANKVFNQPDAAKKRMIF